MERYEEPGRRVCLRSARSESGGKSEYSAHFKGRRRTAAPREEGGGGGGGVTSRFTVES